MAGHSSGHGLVCSWSPISEKSYAVCFEWTAFFFVCSIKTEGQSQSASCIAICILILQASFVCSLDTKFHTVFDVTGMLEVRDHFYPQIQNRTGQILIQQSATSQIDSLQHCTVAYNHHITSEYKKWWYSEYRLCSSNIYMLFLI